MCVLLGDFDGAVACEALDCGEVYAVHDEVVAERVPEAVE